LETFRLFGGGRIGAGWPFCRVANVGDIYPAAWSSTDQARVYSASRLHPVGRGYLPFLNFRAT